MVSSGSTKHYLNSVAKLPLAPTLVTELLALFRDPDKDVSRVVELISYEPSLTVEILRNCNSAYFAGGEPPSDIFEAVARMGFYEVYCLVVAMFGATARSMQGADKGVDIHGLWRHSVAVAVSASVIAERAGESKVVAFTAGLLHDMGKLVLASVERERYAELFETAKMQGIVFNRAEQSALETNHAELGGELMHRWNLPLEIVAAVRYHHDLESAPSYGRLTAVVQLADLVAHQVCGEDLVNTDLMTFSNGAMDRLQFRPDDVALLVNKSQEEMQRVKSMLQI
ncbi:MAG TPA: HDOD domain-containing protein [Candidatus Saccharimonadales bacterium]|nr:HDOD domain-containing protein [Candidatus Saccharimonadales bacterium]